MAESLRWVARTKDAADTHGGPDLLIVDAVFGLSGERRKYASRIHNAKGPADIAELEPGFGASGRGGKRTK